MKNALWSLLLVSSISQAATIAVIDSGLDVEHIDLQENIWINSVEIANNGRDEDRNGYQDDVYGWNFAESNNLVIDRKYLGTFSADPYLYFEIQGKLFRGEATAAEIKWMKDKRNDQAFIKEMGKFGNFIHGTHVSGITVKGNDLGKVLAVKLIPTEVNPFIVKAKSISRIKGDDDLRMTILKGLISALAGQQMNMLEEIAAYVGGHKADIANGSFGTGFNQAKMITNVMFKVAYQRDPSEEESAKLAKFFVNSLVTQGRAMVDAAPNTLFVFAAGNDGMNNDIYPTSPTNIIANNVISVAATYEYEYLAPFSNYGTLMVDVAAPGMLIKSQIPGNEYLHVSGTSQAAPMVANIAAQIKDSNKALTPKEIKEILMGTVDAKAFLTNKVKAAGIVNSNRAVHAAKLSLSMDVGTAISRSRVSIRDVEVTNTKRNTNANAITPMPLTKLFQ
jgi:subtilisin family serine protease